MTRLQHHVASALFVLSLLIVLLSAASALDVSFSADVSATPTRLLPTVYDSFGSSHGSTTLRATWRSHFTQAHSDIPFSRVRFHGILDDDMSTYLGGQANGALVFDTLDYLVAERITPTIEIGFMPDELASNASLTTFHYKGGISPPSDWSKWSAFITQFARLLVERYSAALVRTWRFEVWNEPNCGFYYVQNGCGEQYGNYTAYLSLYTHTAHAVKAADSQLQVGGPATAQLSWLADFVADVTAASTPIDFVSSHLYPTDPQLSQSDRDSFMDAVANATAVARSASLPFLLTEFNAGLDQPAGPSAPLLSTLDTSYAAAFLLHAHLRAQSIDGLLSMSYWTFTDFGFEEGGVDPLPYDPGNSKFGIQTMYGVKKPAYRGLQWMSDWRAGMAVPVKATSGGSRRHTSVEGHVVGASAGTVDVLVSVADGGVVTVLLGNYDQPTDGTPVPAVVDVTLSLTGFGKTPPTNATVEYIDDAHANPYAVWRAAGSPLYPTADEIAAEAAASVPLPAQVAVEADGTGGVRVRVALQPYSVARVRMVAGERRRERFEVDARRGKSVRYATRA